MSAPYPFAEAMNSAGIWFDIMPDTPPTQFQVFGERASGTNVVRKLIERNSRLQRTDGLGWKHGFPAMTGIPRACMVICVVRNPQSWALSMHQRPWHAHPQLQALGFSEFIRSEWDSIVDRPSDFDFLTADIDAKGQPLQLDRHPLTGERFANLFALRRAKLAALAGMVNRDCSLAYVQLEAVQRDEEGFMAAVRAATGSAPKKDHHRPVKRRMGHAFRHAAPDRPAPPKQMSHEDVAFMQGEIDHALETALGYPF